jgi:hypothetical protein
MLRAGRSDARGNKEHLLDAATAGLGVLSSHF